MSEVWQRGNAKCSKQEISALQLGMQRPITHQHFDDLHLHLADLGRALVFGEIPPKEEENKGANMDFTRSKSGKVALESTAQR